MARFGAEQPNRVCAVDGDGKSFVLCDKTSQLLRQTQHRRPVGMESHIAWKAGENGIFGKFTRVLKSALGHGVIVAIESKDDGIIYSGVELVRREK